MKAYIRSHWAAELSHDSRSRPLCERTLSGTSRVMFAVILCHPNLHSLGVVTRRGDLRSKISLSSLGDIVPKVELYLLSISSRLQSLIFSIYAFSGSQS